MPRRARAPYRGPVVTLRHSPARSAPSAVQLRNDLVLAGVILVGGMLSSVLGSIAGIFGDEQGPLHLALIYVVVLATPLAFRRRWPATVAVIVSVAFFAGTTLRLPEIFVSNIAVFIALYTVGAWALHRRRAMVVRVAIMVGMFLWIMVTMYQEAIANADDADVIAGAFSPFLAQAMLNLLINVLYFGGAYYFGEHAWKAAAQREELEQRTAELEREREVTAAQAVALDRVRIARELHDVVAHHVSLMGVQAGAAGAVLDSNPARTREFLTSIESSAREAIDELHHLLDTLRTPGASDDAPASTVGFGALPALAAASTASGVPTTFTVVGEPTPVPAVTEVNLYRIAQEALTNARRHGGPDVQAEARLRYTPDRVVELEVINTGRLVREPRPGLGQIGMRERAASSGGTIEIGPRDRGGFRVRVAVPLPEKGELMDAATGAAR